MKKSVIVSIPMKAKIEKSVYESDDPSLRSTGRAAKFPLIPFLEANLQGSDEVRAILIAKRGEYSFADGHIEELKAEFEQIGVRAEFVTVGSDFEENRGVHEKLMADLVDAIADGSKIIADITYGSKDVPFVIFSALNFAENHLGCEVENIIYGQAFFGGDGEMKKSRLCDMSPLYTLNGLTNVIRSTSPEKARQALRSVISL